MSDLIERTAAIEAIGQLKAGIGSTSNISTLGMAIDALNGVAPFPADRSSRVEGVGVKSLVDALSADWFQFLNCRNDATGNQAEEDANVRALGRSIDALRALSATVPAPVRDGYYRRDYRALHAEALAAVQAFDDWANVNETEFTGWGDGDVPPAAEMTRVKSGQAMRALRDALPASPGDNT